jgi:competence protein ComEA
MFRQLHKSIRKYFGISRTETNGILVLILLMIVLVILPLIYRQFGKGGYRNYEQDLALMDSLARYMNIAPDNRPDDTLSAVITVTLTSFDPNEVSFDEMIRMGFDSILTRRIVSYRNKGGRFYKENDLLKIYDFPGDLYERVSPYIRLKDSKHLKDHDHTRDTIFSDRNFSPRREVDRLSFNLNLADTAQLSLIRGIGPVLSGRIIKYRELLGGFIRTEQLNEVFGLKDEALINLKQAVFVDSLFEPAKIRVNFSEWQELIRHPYIQPDLANRIINFRSQDGPYLDGQDFTRRLDLPDSLSDLLVPYFGF